MLGASLDRIKRVKVDTAAGGTVALIAGVANQRIQILGLDLTLAAGTVQFLSAAVTLTGAMTFTSKTLPLLPINDGVVPWYVCTAGSAFNAAFSGLNQCSGELIYLQE
jgi:hypothetical protein